MKRTILFVMLAFCALPSVAVAQVLESFRIIYIRQDNSTNASELAEKLKRHMSLHSNEPYMIYYSDVEPLVMDNQNYSETILYGTIGTKNSHIGVNTLVEMDMLSTRFEQKTPYGFKSLSIDLFVGEDYFLDGGNNDFLARFLIVNSVERLRNLEINYHVCGGNVDEGSLGFDSKYNINVKPNLVL